MQRLFRPESQWLSFLFPSAGQWVHTVVVVVYDMSDQLSCQPRHMDQHTHVHTVQTKLDITLVWGSLTLAQNLAASINMD